jgi:anti-sigma factor RsiW
MMNPGRDQFLPLLSAYVDGELTASERQAVEAHLAADPVSARLVEDLRAGGVLLRTSLEHQGDAADWPAFTDAVMSRLTPHQLPPWERFTLFFSELFTWHRGPMLAGALGAAVAIAVAIPLTLSLSTPDGYGAARVQVQTVAVEEAAQVKPVVMETDDGDAVIWVIDAPPEAPAPDAATPAEPGKTPETPTRKGEL